MHSTKQWHWKQVDTTGLQGVELETYKINLIEKYLFSLLFWENLTETHKYYFVNKLVQKSQY